MAHNWIEGTLADVSNDQAHWQPQGKPNPIGGQYGHVLATEDFVVTMLKGSAPLMASDYAGKTGMSELPPPAPWDGWARQVKVDMPAMRGYAQAVYASTNTYLDTISDEDINRPLDLSGLGFGMQTIGFALQLLVLNVYSHTGEISALKGLQGNKGYPA
jgi:hypothetical protein